MTTLFEKYNLSTRAVFLIIISIIINLFLPKPPPPELPPIPISSCDNKDLSSCDTPKKQYSINNQLLVNKDFCNLNNSSNNSDTWKSIFIDYVTNSKTKILNITNLENDLKHIEYNYNMSSNDESTKIINIIIELANFTSKEKTDLNIDMAEKRKNFLESIFDN